MCNGRWATREEIPYCYTGRDWKGVTLDEFLDCDDNLARNRQTRMLADLRLVGCHNKTAMDPHLRDKLMLESAKRNLLKMAYFGITDFQSLSQKLFEYTFNKAFKTEFYQSNSTIASTTNLTKQQLDRIVYHTRLDIELYHYAKELFFHRVNLLKKRTDLADAKWVCSILVQVGETEGIKREEIPGPNFIIKDLPLVLILIIADQILNDLLCCSNR